jgi:hypothetical protein
LAAIIEDTLEVAEDEAETAAEVVAEEPKGFLTGDVEIPEGFVRITTVVNGEVYETQDLTSEEGELNSKFLTITVPSCTSGEPDVTLELELFDNHEDGAVF